MSSGGRSFDLMTCFYISCVKFSTHSLLSFKIKIAATAMCDKKNVRGAADYGVSLLSDTLYVQSVTMTEKGA